MILIIFFAKGSDNVAKALKRDNSDSRIASLKLQDKEYNEMYRKWRIDHKNDYGFYFLDNSDELTYRDGEGFITEYPEAAERSAVSGIHSIVANTLIMYVLLNILNIAVNYLLPIKYSRDFSYDPAGFFTGNETKAIIFSFITNIVIRILPMVYLLRKIKIPFKVIAPVRISNKPLFYMAVPMAMLIFAINTLLSGAEYFFVGAFGIDTRNRIWLPDSPSNGVLYCILTVIIIPVISEFIHRGIFMQILRQFGDGYALVATSIIYAMVSGQSGAFFFMIISSLMIGYFSIRTGSIVTALLMRVTISASSYFLTYARMSMKFEGLSVAITMAILSIYLIIGIGSLVTFMKNHSNKISLPLYSMYLGEKERFMCCVTNPSVIMWISVNILYMIICRMQ